MRGMSRSPKPSLRSGSKRASTGTGRSRSPSLIGTLKEGIREIDREEIDLEEEENEEDEAEEEVAEAEEETDKAIIEEMSMVKVIRRRFTLIRIQAKHPLTNKNANNNSSNKNKVNIAVMQDTTPRQKQNEWGWNSATSETNQKSIALLNRRWKRCARCEKCASLRSK